MHTFLSFADYMYSDLLRNLIRGYKCPMASKCCAVPLKQRTSEENMEKDNWVTWLDIHDDFNFLSVLTWVQTVCKGHQQTNELCQKERVYSFKLDIFLGIYCMISK